MPELPDLLHVLEVLRKEVLHRTIDSQRVLEPVVLRFVVPGDLGLLVGKRVDDITRHAHFVIFRFSDLELAVNPMLAGRFRLAEAGERDEASLAFALGLSGDGPAELRYLDDKSMGKAYLIRAGEYQRVPAWPRGGLDVLARTFTWDRFRAVLARRRDQVRVFLLDKSALDSIGNAYADEILFEAGIHPKTFCRSLKEEDGRRLFEAIRNVLHSAAAEVKKRGEPIEVKVRDFLKVRLKETCPRCGSKIRKAGVRGMDAYFCPRCQPASRAHFVDWSKTPR